VAGDARGPSTRAVHAGLPAPAQGEPFLPGRCSPRRSASGHQLRRPALERRAARSLGTDAVPERFIRFRNGIEDADIVGDVTDALDATR
jgi:hypothetical protein